MKFIISFCVIFCLGFSTQGCAKNPHWGHDGSSAYRLGVFVQSGSLVIVLANKSDHAIADYGWFRAQGSGSAGLYFLFSDANGRKYHLCALIDQALGGGQLQPHASMRTEISMSELRSEYCLEPGIYTLRVTYALPRSSAAPEIVAHAAPISVTVK